ncbi:MAG: glycosyltransferase [Candidatus Sumerlaeota bacterium]|nr:glycosyltransferase [Candidatus Sumerlaeota bacterium]
MIWLIPFSRFGKTLWRRPEQAAGPPPLFFYSQVVWDEVWQRPQEFALIAALRRPVIFFCPAQIHRLSESIRRWRRAKRIVRDGGDLTVVTPLILPGEYKSRLIRRLNAALIRAEVRKWVGDGAGIVFLTNSPFAEPLRSAFNWRATVYDVIDDYASFSWAPPEARAWHEALVRECAAVVTGTNSLLEQVRPARPEAQYIPSGVRFEQFYREARGAVPFPRELRGLSGPIVGYAGSISDRLEPEIIRAAAARYPEANFIMVGPIHGSFGRPPLAPNLHYLGLKSHEDLPLYLNHFDVALLPFRNTPAAMATNPVKTLEYLAGGALVVSTAIPDVVQFYSDIVLIARSPEDFVDKIGEAIHANHRTRRKKGIERAREASWEQTALGIETAIEAALEKA